MVDDLKIIKKKYGENMSHLCRELFSTILEQNGVLSKLMLDNFNETHDLYDDIVSNDLINDFKTFIYNIFDNRNYEVKDATKTPKELLNIAGYDLVECTKESEIQYFKKYYAKGEELCTFDGNRLNKCRVFFAIKKNVDEIKRENFKNPDRQDEYGTSVISIQFTKDKTNTLSIKNRYNHRVNNPDATFSNNLDNIIEGLTYSFEKYYGIKQTYINSDFEIPDYVRANDGKYYKCNYEIDNICYCPDNIIIDNFNVKTYEKEKYIILDYFILDLVNKKIMLYDKTDEDSFVETITNIEKIEIINIDKGKIIKIKTKDDNDIEIELDKLNRITKYTNNKITKINDWFLHMNDTINELNIPNVELIGRNCCWYSENLKILNAPKIKGIGNDSFHYSCIEKINFANLENLGDFCFNSTGTISILNLPKLKNLGCCCFRNKSFLCDINLPSLEIMENSCFSDALVLEKIYLPNLQKMGDYCFLDTYNFISFYAPKLEYIGENCFFYNRTAEKIYLFSLKKMGFNCFWHNTSVKDFNIPLDAITDSCFPKNEYIRELLKNKNLVLKKMLI